MKIIQQSHEILHMDDLHRIELAGRTCYKSEEKITPESAPRFAEMLIARRHEAMLEHGSATVKFVTNRGVTHEIVRHRLCSFGQESTRFVNYGGKDIAFILPVWVNTRLPLDQPLSSFHVRMDPPCRMTADERWLLSMLEAEEAYHALLSAGWAPEQARETLPQSLKTEIVVTANYREWRHILNLRAVGTTGRPHPQMQALMSPLLEEFRRALPAVFGDLASAAV